MTGKNCCSAQGDKDLILFYFCCFSSYIEVYNPFELILCMVLGRGPKFILCMGIVHCLSTICWKNYFFPIVLSWHICWRSVDHKRVHFWILYFIIMEYVYLSIVTIIILSQCLEFYNRFQNQYIWVLQLSFFKIAVRRFLLCLSL